MTSADIPGEDAGRPVDNPTTPTHLPLHRIDGDVQAGTVPLHLQLLVNVDDLSATVSRTDPHHPEDDHEQEEADADNHDGRYADVCPHTAQVAATLAVHWRQRYTNQPAYNTHVQGGAGQG